MRSSLHRAAACGIGFAAVLTLSACRQDMQDEPRYKPLAAALDIRARDGNRELVDIFAIHLSRVSRFIDAQMTPRHRTLYLRTRRAMIREEFARGQRFVARLILHVLPAGGQR